MCLLSSFSSFHILDIRNGKVFRYERIVKHVQKYDEELEETWDSDYTTNGDNMSCFWNDADEQLQKSREREHEDKDGRGRRKNGGLKNDNRRARCSKYE